jgi:hypothetical protein
MDGCVGLLERYVLVDQQLALSPGAVDRHNWGPVVRASDGRVSSRASLFSPKKQLSKVVFQHRSSP